MPSTKRSARCGLSLRVAGLILASQKASSAYMLPIPATGRCDNSSVLTYRSERLTKAASERPVNAGSQGSGPKAASVGIPL